MLILKNQINMILKEFQFIWTFATSSNYTIRFTDWKPLKDLHQFQYLHTTSGAPVYIEVAEGSAATISGSLGNYSLVTNSQTGIVSITYFTVENDHPNYLPATHNSYLDIVKLNQNISFSPEPPLEVNYSDNLELTINASSDSNLTVNISKSDSGSSNLTDISFQSLI